MNQATATAETVNIARHLPLQAAARPYQRAVVITAGRHSDGRASYLQATFAQLDRLTDRYAHALQAAGVGRGDRVLILVRPGIDLPAVIYAVFKVGGSAVFIDPGMGLKHLVDGVARVEPKAFVGVSRAQMALSLFGRRALKTIDVRLTVGGGLGWGASSLERLAEAAPETPFPLAPTLATDEAAVLFTSGSTGPAKGVVYQHGMFEQQVRHLREVYGIEPGEVDLPGLPIFALFSVALGATTVFPEIDPTRPASLDPALFVEIVEDHGVTYSFGSPAIWKPVTAHCLEHGITLPSLRRVLMAGAPVPPVLHERLGQILDPAADTHTPYGATEALPVSTISGSELKETFATTNAGGGTCVGRPLPGVDLRIIAIDDAVIETWDAVTEQEAGQRGEIVVSGPQVTHEYCAQPEATRKAKIREAATIWHRMGDLGYFDDQGRLWFLGRKAHRVVEETPDGPVTHYPVACEAIFNTHEQVSRSALIPLDGKPAIVIEPDTSAGAAFPRGAAAREAFVASLEALAAAHPHTARIETFLFHPSFPVDLRHNAKIRREDLAAWAASGGR